jgi:hypothetical protein
VNKYFGALPPGPPLPRTEIWIPNLDRDIRDEMEDQVPQVRVYRRWHAAAWKDADVARLQLLGDVLAGSKSARLDKRLVYEKGIATSVSAGVQDSELGGSFGITVTLKNGADQAEAEREVDRIVNELLEKGPTAEELARVKTRELAEFSRGIERLGGFGGRADVLAESMTYGGTPDAYLTRLEQMANATPADVKAAGNRWLRANHYTMTVKPFAKLAGVKSGFDRKQLPALGQAPDVSFPAMQRAQLKNGLKVVLLERHGAPIVNAALVLDAGAAPTRPARKAWLRWRWAWSTRAPRRATPSSCPTRWSRSAPAWHRHLAGPVGGAPAGDQRQPEPVAGAAGRRHPQRELPAGPGRAGQAAPPGPGGAGKGPAERAGGARDPGLLYGAGHATAGRPPAPRPAPRRSPATTSRAGTTPGSARAARPWSWPATPRSTS